VLSSGTSVFPQQLRSTPSPMTEFCRGLVVHLSLSAPDFESRRIPTSLSLASRLDDLHGKADALKDYSQSTLAIMTLECQRSHGRRIELLRNTFAEPKSSASWTPVTS
jgi:hypothetical protein